MVNNSLPTRRRALLALGAMVALPFSPLASIRTDAKVAEESTNSLWRPIDSFRWAKTNFRDDISIGVATTWRKQA